MNPSFDSTVDWLRTGEYLAIWVRTAPAAFCPNSVISASSCLASRRLSAMRRSKHESMRFDSGWITPWAHKSLMLRCVMLFTVSSEAVRRKPILVSRTALLKSRCNRLLLIGKLQPWPMLRKSTGSVDEPVTNMSTRAAPVLIAPGMALSPSLVLIKY